jgi:hypothetical protein
MLLRNLTLALGLIGTSAAGTGLTVQNYTNTMVVKTNQTNFDEDSNTEQGKYFIPSS